jgi:hypothetical protein
VGVVDKGAKASVREEEERKEVHRVEGGIESAEPRKEYTARRGAGDAAAAAAAAAAAVQVEVEVGASGRRGLSAAAAPEPPPVVVSTPGGKFRSTLSIISFVIAEFA